MNGTRRKPGSLQKTMLLLGLALLGGCPDVREGAPRAQCVKAYDQCTLSTGVLGVCDAVACAADQTPPCLVCRSQH